jgi:hypothetical protein
VRYCSGVNDGSVCGKAMMFLHQVEDDWHAILRPRPHTPDDLHKVLPGYSQCLALDAHYISTGLRRVLTYGTNGLDVSLDDFPPLNSRA